MNSRYLLRTGLTQGARLTPAGVAAPVGTACALALLYVALRPGPTRK